MIPKKIMKDNKIYVFVKEYPNVILYQQEKTEIKECFNKSNLGLVNKPARKIHKPVIKGLNGEKVY